MAVIGGIAIIGVLTGFFASHLLLGYLEGRFETLTGFVSSWSERWAWFPWVSWFAILVLSAIIAWEVTDYEIPVDCYDYAIVSGKSIVASLLLALIWVHLFSKATIATFLTTFASIGVVVVVAARTIIVYAIIDELTS